MLFLYNQSHLRLESTYSDYFGHEMELTDSEKKWLDGRNILIAGVDEHMPPFGFADIKTGVYSGLLADYLHAVSQKINKKIIAVPVDSDEMEMQMEAGRIDFAVATYSDKTEKYAEFTYPVIKSKDVVCADKNSGIRTFSELAGKTVISCSKNAFDRIGKDKAGSINLIYAENAEEGVEKLISRKAQAVIGDEAVIAYYLREKGVFNQYYFFPHAVGEKNYSLIVNQNNQTLQGILNKAVQNLHKENTVQKLQLKWFGLSSALADEVILDRIAIIIYIFVIAGVCIFYFAYESYRTVYSELRDRMEMLATSRNDLQTTYDSVTMFMIEVDPDFNIVNANKAFLSFLEMKKNAITGKKLHTVLNFNEKASEDLGKEITDTFKLGKSGKTEIKNKGKIYEVFTFPLIDAKDRVSKVLLMLNDVTYARAAERQMLQDNKMIAIGQLAAGVAHEIRNPLGLIRNYCYILKNSENYDENAKKIAISMIEKAVNRSSKIIDNLLNFSRISNNKWETVNLNKFLRMVISLEENLLQKNMIKVELNCSPNIEIDTVTESLEIILVNLILNAADAMQNGGKIKIDAECRDGTLFLAVADTGEGIPEDVLPNIFNPFFTTKEKRDGNGLGLYIVYNEISKLGGKIKVTSKVSEGTAFIMELPVKRGEENVT